ncbi:hypothetical protein [Mycolicibacterium mucogenicum]|uniref:Uncharacterized protein n=1 Tax=Mycolicibacterium mucogenicum DSM 44124 TaxID=1226753 RepID=A0A8H2PEI8_MYCMU|nr:hypothetical protein [Mycolicibacterium mucogenicum]KAB7761180.1 hypothetical protein MMUC44124_00865 [Mycolicibacterium mucogenicum DSM 44124]QPG69986.1 hypothetical protein C1S78_002860 [Mycolicibacterium mucogenicum DSM 44124]
MSQPVRIDPAIAIIGSFIAALKSQFDPNQPVPPDGGGTKNVRFFAADGPPLEAWDAFSNETDCDEPFIWVRVVSRYRSKNFPEPVINVNPCGLPRVLAIEIGVARCAAISLDTSWEDYDKQAGISLDDSYRIEQALCAVTNVLKHDNPIGVGTDTLVPFGPEGGRFGWSAQAYIGF